MLKTHQLKRDISLAKDPDEVFSFFARAENLNLITPDWLNFKILTPPPIKMAKGTLIDYQIQLGWFKLNWRTEITEWNPPYSFVDKQINGPYLVWEHQHDFEKDGKNTIVRDRINYAVPGGILEPYIHFFYVRKKLDRIFDYRLEAIRKIFT